MADGNFTTNQRLLGKYVHEMEILLLAKIRRMATKHVAKNDRIVSPLGRPPDLGSFFSSLLKDL
jgi:hypothetical protein